MNYSKLINILITIIIQFHCLNIDLSTNSESLGTTVQSHNRYELNVFMYNPSTCVVCLVVK